MKRLMIGGAVALAAIGSPAMAVNMLTNGSFEDGFTGWTVTSNESSTGTGAALPVVIAYNQSSGYPTGAYGEVIPADNAATNPGFDAVGTHGAYFVSDFANPQTLSQEVTLVAGTSYTFGFDIYAPNNGASNPNGATFTASLAGDPFASFSASALPVATWTHFSDAATFVATVSGTFAFNFTSDGYPAKDFVIDRVYLSETSTLPAVPEPATWAMLVVGFGLVGAASRRRKSISAIV